jgi:cobalt-zinc-cadmium efflux system protein
MSMAIRGPSGDHDHHEHEHGHGHLHHGEHQHGEGGNNASRAFGWSIVLNSLLTGVQLAIGLGCGSLALVGDALHNLGDVVGLGLGWGAERLSQRPPRGRFTYGYGRSTHMASLLNGLLIFSAGAVVVVEGLQRVWQPVPLQSGPVAVAALAGIIVNLVSARLFGHGHHHDLNQRAAVLHLLSDAAVSLAVLTSALVVGATGWLRLDGLTAIGVGLAVMASAWGLLGEAIAANLDAVPAGVDPEALRQALASLPGVLEVRDLHVWGVSSSQTALTVHLRRRLDATPPSRAFLTLARQRLAQFGIAHSTLEVEEGEPGSD